MKTSKMRMREMLCAALAALLLAGTPCAAWADGGVSVPPSVEEGAIIPESAPAPEADVPETEEAETQWPELGETEFVQPEFAGPEQVWPETGATEYAEPQTVLPETAVPPLPEQTVAAFVEPEQPAEEGTDQTSAYGTEWDDPLYHKRMEQISTVSLVSDSFERYTPRALKSNEVLRRGVDVSVYQYGVDWKTAAANGIEFAIVRAAYRGSTTGLLFTDNYCAQNLAGAHAAGLKVGAYIFSQATTVEEAREEARYLVQAVSGYTIDLPLVFDYEETTNSDRRLKMSELDRQLKTDICKAFCQEVEAAGYESMVYSNPSTINNHLYREQLGRLWLAHFTTETTHSSPYEYWQCGIGKVEGIAYDVDLDFWFDPDGVATPPGNGNVVTPTEQPAPTQQPSPTPEPTPTPAAPPAPTPTPAAPPVTPQPNQSNPFGDVTGDKWFYDSVLWAYGKGIVNGLSATSFGPNATATRGQLVAMLYRMQGQPPASGTVSFTDLTEDYYKNAVLWASTNGIVSGYSQTAFAPNNKVTREQLATMLYRMAGSPAVSGDLTRFTDAGSIHDYALSAMAWAVEKGVVTGYANNTVKPGASATRAEVCTMLSRFAALG